MLLKLKIFRSLSSQMELNANKMPSYHKFAVVAGIDPHTLTSLGGYVTIFSDKTTLKMAVKHIIQFSDHLR